MKGGGWPGGGGRAAKGIPGRGGRRAEAPGWEGCGRREGQRGRQCWWVGHVGWGDPRLARAPGDEGPGAREAVRRKGVGLEGRPESARPPPPLPHRAAPGTSGDAAPGRSCQPGPGQEDSECGPGSRAGHPGIRRVRTPVRCGGTLPFHPEAEAQEAPPSPDALENVVSVSNRGESRPPWLGSVPSGAGRLTRSVGSRAPRRRAPCPPNPPRPQSPGERAGPVCKASGFLREVEADRASSSSPTHPPEAPEGQAPGLGGGRARLTFLPAREATPAFPQAACAMDELCPCRRRWPIKKMTSPLTRGRLKGRGGHSSRLRMRGGPELLTRRLSPPRCSADSVRPAPHIPQEPSLGARRREEVVVAVLSVPGAGSATSPSPWTLERKAIAKCQCSEHTGEQKISGNLIPRERAIGKPCVSALMSESR